MQLKIKKMCKACPWRNNSLQGYLGEEYNVPRFALPSHSGQDMPCHKTVNYSGDNWEDNLATSNHCAGFLMAMKRNCVMPREPLKADAVKNIVIQEEHLSYKQFIKYHEGGK